MRDFYSLELTSTSRWEAFLDIFASASAGGVEVRPCTTSGTWVRPRRPTAKCARPAGCLPGFGGFKCFIARLSFAAKPCRIENTNTRFFGNTCRIWDTTIHLHTAVMNGSNIFRSGSEISVPGSGASQLNIRKNPASELVTSVHGSYIFQRSESFK